LLLLDVLQLDKRVKFHLSLEASLTLLVPLITVVILAICGVQLETLFYHTIEAQKIQIGPNVLTVPAPAPALQVFTFIQNLLKKKKGTFNNYPAVATCTESAKNCVFPFTFRGQTYSSCTTSYTGSAGYSWCSVGPSALPYDRGTQDGDWSKCVTDCSSGNEKFSPVVI